MSWLLAGAIRAALLLAASWLGAALLRRGSAAARHQIWTLGVIGALLVPFVPSLALSSHAPTIVSTRSLDALAVIVTGAPQTSSSWPMWLAITWIVGTVIVMARWTRGYLAARRLIRAAEPTIPASWSAALASLSSHVDVLRSASISSPMTIGVVRPRVLLPAAADAWAADRLRAVFVHELGHVRRHDMVIQLAAQVACALYWWNPLAWLAAARLRIEREHACDDLVLGAGVLPSSYAGDLLAVARSISQVPASAIGMVDTSSTEARIGRILDANAPRPPLRARFRWAARGIACVGVLALACTESPPPSSRGTLSVGTPFVRAWDMSQPPTSHGEVDLALVATEVQRHVGALEDCYEHRLAVEPSLAGTVIIHANVAPTGDVTDACITENTVGDEAVIACVNKLVLESQFPAPQGGSVDVSIPFVFAPP